MKINKIYPGPGYTVTEDDGIDVLAWVKSFSFAKCEHKTSTWVCEHCLTEAFSPNQGGENDKKTNQIRN